MLQQLAVRFWRRCATVRLWPPFRLSSEVFVEGSTKEGHVISSSRTTDVVQMVKRPDLLASKAVALSPPSDGLLGRWELRTVTKYGTKRFHESVWNDSDITDVTWFTAINSDVMSFKKIHEPKFWPNPCNSHVIHTAFAYSAIPHVHGGLVSGFLGRSLARLYELKFVAEEVPEVVGLQKSSELPTWHSFQLRDLPQATQRRRPPRIWPPSQEQPSVGGLRTETSIIAGAISASCT